MTHIRLRDCYLGEDLRDARLALGLTQKALGAALGVSQATIWRWESNQMEIRHPTILRLALERLARTGEEE